MGQQQLLLLVLGIVIVGIAVVAGIQAFSEGKAKAQQDAAVSDAMRIISDVQAWMLKPAAFGGGEGSTAQVNFKTLGYPTDALTAQNLTYTTINGCFTLGTSADGPTLAIFAEPEMDDADPPAPTGDCDNKIADVTIEGAGTGDIKWKYATTN